MISGVGRSSADRTSPYLRRTRRSRHPCRGADAVRRLRGSPRSKGANGCAGPPCRRGPWICRMSRQRSACSRIRRASSCRSGWSSQILDQLGAGQLDRGQRCAQFMRSRRDDTSKVVEHLRPAQRHLCRHDGIAHRIHLVGDLPRIERQEHHGDNDGHPLSEHEDIRDPQDEPLFGAQGHVKKTISVTSVSAVAPMMMVERKVMIVADTITGPRIRMVNGLCKARRSDRSGSTAAAGRTEPSKSFRPRSDACFRERQKSRSDCRQWTPQRPR